LRITLRADARVVKSVTPSLSSPLTMSLFSAVEMAPRDPILGLNEAFNADTRPNKVNLGVGVYYNEEGRIPLLRAVAEAEQARIAAHAPRGYLPIEGIAAYDNAVQKLLFGNDAALIAEGRVVTTQALGGTGALKVGADFLKRLLPDAVVAISNPSWENHRALFESAGFPVQSYRYYDATSHGIDRAGLLQDLNELPARSIVVLHACCHNPTGVDLDLNDWKQILEVLRARDHVPFIDIAYQGFGDSIEEDAAAVRLFAESGMTFFVSSSFSKSFSLYGERVGALSMVTQSRDESARVLSQVKRVPPWSPPCSTARNCAPCGKPSWARCAAESARCAWAWSSNWQPRARKSTSASSRRNAACSPIRGSLPNRSSACGSSSVSMPSAPAASAPQR